MTPLHITLAVLLLALAIVLRRPLFIRPLERLLGWQLARHYRKRRSATRCLLQDGAQCLAYSRALNRQRRRLVSTLPAVTAEDHL